MNALLDHLLSTHPKTEVLSQIANAVGWSTILDNLGSKPLKHCADLAKAAPQQTQKTVLDFMIRRAEGLPKKGPEVAVLAHTLIDLNVADGTLWSKAMHVLTTAFGQDDMKRSVCIRLIPFSRINLRLLQDAEFYRDFRSIREDAGVLYSWQEMNEPLQKHSPSTDLGWPACVDPYKMNYNSTVAQIERTEKTIHTDDSYMQPIIGNGKLLIGDFHSNPEGMVVLHHMLSQLPVEALFLEERVADVVENPEFMRWLKDNPDAPIADAVDKVIEHVHAKETPAGKFFRDLRKFGFDLMTVREISDTWIRWTELKCSIARIIVTKQIPVKVLFNTPLFVEGTEPRKLDGGIWEEFKNPTQGKVNVFFGGEAHITNGSYQDEETYMLLEKSDGIFARGSHEPHERRAKQDLRKAGTLLSDEPQAHRYLEVRNVHHGPARFAAEHRIRAGAMQP